MKQNNLNQWLTLIANLGVMIGLIVVIFELQQTQTAMLAESSSTRAQLMSENVSIGVYSRFGNLATKLQDGEGLSEEELAGANEFIGRMLRHMENVHYQYQLGVLDEEIWEAARNGMRVIRNSPVFEHIYPQWPSGMPAIIHRASFVEFVESLTQ